MKKNDYYLYNTNKFIKFNQVAIYQNSDNLMQRMCTSHMDVHIIVVIFCRKTKKWQGYSLVKFPILLKKLNLSKKNVCRKTKVN